MWVFSTLTWNVIILNHCTLESDFWFASIVTSPAQQTKALELDRPELGGMVPSTTHDIPANWAIPNFSCEKNKKQNSSKVNSIIVNYVFFQHWVLLIRTKYTSYLDTFHSTEKIIMPLWILSVDGDVLWTGHGVIPTKWQTPWKLTITYMHFKLLN